MDTMNGTNDMPSETTRNPLVHDYPHPLKIAIIGAGIGGLAAAIGLRREGHDISLYEQSRFANEVGAAVHLTPNSNGILRRWGIFAAEFGGSRLSHLKEFHADGKLFKHMDRTGHDDLWQHPWEQVHRVALHDRLKKVAAGEEGIGKPATLHTSSQVVSVDPKKGSITLADGSVVKADVILGADGIYSKSRKSITGKEPTLFSSGKAAFRFMIPTKAALEDPETSFVADLHNTFGIWYAPDRRVVIYPCNNNETLNLVCIHPDSESHATATDEWSKTGSLQQVLKVYEGFNPALLKLFQKVKPEELKVWQLLDMEKLPTWTNQKLALMGDAAHPFTPHQGQGAGQAMEDGAALSVVLPRGTSPEDVPDRLKLYETIRYERAHNIQEFSRQTGKDWVDGKQQIDIMAYMSYNFGHDEIDYANNVFKRWLWAKKKDLRWRMPLSFGPFPGPRQDGLGSRQPGESQRTFTTASIRFRTSRTYLETLFPNESYKFKSFPTVCEASFSVTTLDNMAWLGGKGYSHFGLYIHGVQYTKKDSSKVDGNFLPVLLEDLSDPIISGREELGMPKLFCDIDIQRESSSYRMKASWRGATFAELVLEDLEEGGPQSQTEVVGDENNNILAYRYIPAVGEPGKADAEYPILAPHEKVSKTNKVLETSNASVSVKGLDWESLPTLHHVASGLANIPIYSVLTAKVVEGTGVPDLSSCQRVE
ncbi:Fc.00g112280.m01.CDS01 [Cosmosporella sp. VM-42]